MAVDLEEARARMKQIDTQIESLYAERDGIEKRINRLEREHENLWRKTRCTVVPGCRNERGHVGAHPV